MQNQVNQNQFLDQVFDSLQNGVVIFDKDLRIKKTNKWILDKLAPQKELSDLHRYKYINTPNSLSPDSPVLKAFKSAESFKEIVQDPFGEGENKSYEVSTYPIHNEKGEVNYVIENYCDISDLKYDEKTLNNKNKEHLASIKDLEEKSKVKLEENIEQLEAKDQLAQTIYNNATSIMMLLNSNTEIIDINETGLLFFEKSKKQVIGLQIGTLFTCINTTTPPYMCGKGEKCSDCIIRKTVGNTLKTGKNSKRIKAMLVTQQPDNSTKRLILMVSSTLINEKEGKNLLVTIDDITQLKQQEQQIVESEEKYRALYNNAPLAYQSLNADGNIIEVNPQWLKTLGYQQEEVIGKWFGDFLHPDMRPSFIQRFPKFKSEGVSHNTQFSMQKKDGTNIDVSYEGCIAYDDQGNFKQTYCTFKDITFEKSAIHKLKENEERFRKLFQTIPDAVIVTGSDGVLSDINDNFTKLFGYTKEEAIGTRAIESNIWCNSDDREEVLESLDKNGNLSNKEVCFRAKSGKMITTLLSASKIILNKKTFILSIIRDISTLKLERYSLQKAQEIGKIGTWTLDVKNTCMFWTEELYKIYDIELGTPITYDLFISRVHPKDRKQVKALWENALQGEHFNAEHRLLINSKVKWVRAITDFRNNHIKGENIIGITQDITHLKQSERNLKHALQKMEAIFLSNPTTIGHVQNRNFKDLNKNIFKLTGYNPQELLGKGTRIIYPSNEEYENIFNEQTRQIKENGVGTIETKFQKKDGSLVDVLISAAPLDPTDVSKGTIFTALDISERKKAEMQLKENVLLLEKKNDEIAITNKELKKAKEAAEEANRLKTEFLNNMSHEIRTPMNGIMGFSGMLSNQELNDNKKNNYINIIQSSSKQLLKIMDDILDISILETKQEKIDETTLCLNDLFMETFSIFNLKSKERSVPIYLKKELSDKQSYIISDKTKLSKILNNLLENALKFTTEGYIELGYMIEQSTLKVYVKDTGVGIAKEHQEIIFDRFAQSDKEIRSKHGGLGLGLSISRENAQLLGGDISLESKKGEGSTFYINLPYLPVNNESADAGINSLDSGKEEDITYTILVAEDEEINYLYIEALLIDLTDKNYKLLHAINGKQAVDICIENKAIDLVLMDIKMPIMGGYEAIDLIKSKFPDLPIIAQTAYSSKSDRKQAIERGCSAFISKPINKNDLLTLIEEYLVKK